MSLSRSLVPGSGPGVASTDFLDPASFLMDLNRQLINPEGEVENYATIAYGTLEKGTGRVLIALAGHPYPMVVRQTGEITYLKNGGLPVGMFAAVEYESQELSLAPGDKLVLYSDGVTECSNLEGQPFGQEQLRDALAFASRSQLPLTVILDDRLRQWRGPRDFEDDISLLVLERPPKPQDEGSPTLHPPSPQATGEEYSTKTVACTTAAPGWREGSERLLGTQTSAEQACKSEN